MRNKESQIYQAATLRGIVNLLDKAPASMFEIELIMHLSHRMAKRLCRKLEQAGIICHPPIHGVSPKNAPELRWKLSDAFLHGKIEFDANDLSREA